ncbi:uncharacterized protein N7459_004028 [Penicillium hispanicum]|uniref:uncharacterized protein n=1 Tax=Penicillium hispanicum TaxID=1080232 RepID=UPI00253FC242|nr:uncharacterized protein N7459_004028 [Penicillium hispanicum]KAJ5584228.1 hypothetical protein N7459_004028 [Penicillium hispanicum]
MHLQTSILAVGLFTGLSSAGTLTVMLNPKNHTECVVQSINNQGCGSEDNPAYSGPWGYSKDGKTCEGREHSWRAVAGIPICGYTGEDDESKWSAAISFRTPDGSFDFSKVIGMWYEDLHKKDHNPLIYCDLPSSTENGSRVYPGASCSPTPPTSSAAAATAAARRV